MFLLGVEWFIACILTSVRSRMGKLLLIQLTRFNPQQAVYLPLRSTGTTHVKRIGKKLFLRFSKGSARVQLINFCVLLSILKKRTRRTFFNLEEHNKERVLFEPACSFC